MSTRTNQTDHELAHEVTNDPTASARELALADRLTTAIDEVRDLARELTDVTEQLEAVGGGNP